MSRLYYFKMNYWQDEIYQISTIIDHIAAHLCEHDILICKKVCRIWNQIFKSCTTKECQYLVQGHHVPTFSRPEIIEKNRRLSLIECSARHGYLSRMEYLRTHKYPWTKYVSYCAAAEGHLDCLKYAHENGCPWHPSSNKSCCGRQDRLYRPR